MLSIALHATESVKENLHLFLLAGQSNMAGRGTVDAASQQNDGHIWAWTKAGKWALATDPLHWDKGGAGVGPGKSFAESIRAQHPEIEIGLIPTACGGSPIRTWKPGEYFNQTNSHPYDDAIARARAAMASGQLKAILWHQGESDANVQNAALYEAQLRELITRFRTDLDSPQLPFLIGQLGQFPGKSWNDFTKEVDAAQQRVAASMEQVYFISSSGLLPRSDQIHFSTEAARTLGQRYATVYLNLQADQ